MGLGIPLAVMAVQGWNRLLLPRALGVALLLLATVVGGIPVAMRYRTTLQNDRSALYATPDQAAAFRYLEDSPDAGGVLAPYYLGKSVPAFTGRNTWIGHPTLTPDFYTRRLSQANAIFAGRLSSRAAQSMVRATGAAYVLIGCDSPSAVANDLRELASSIRRFGCISVMELSSDTEWQPTQEPSVR